MNGTIREIPSEKIGRFQTVIDKKQIIKCPYYKNKLCIYFDGLCNPYSVKCTNRGILALLSESNSKSKRNKSDDNKSQDNITYIQQPKYVKAVILSNNRKCIYEEHDIIGISATFKVLISNKVSA